MFWFKIRGGTLLEMTSLPVPQFDCLQLLCRESVFGFYFFGIKIKDESQHSNHFRLHVDIVM